MTYKNRTRFYGMPVISKNDQITENDEMIQYGIIDSLLYLACFGSRKAIIEDGNYSIQFNEDGTGAYLLISKNGQSSHAIFGILNGRVFYSEQTLKIGRLVPNMTYYVYVEYNESLELNPMAIRTGFYVEEQENSPYSIPLCVITTTPGSPVIDLDVDKPNISSVLSGHIEDNLNPHGETIIQKNMEITGSITVHGNALHECTYDTYTTKQEEYELVMPLGKTPVFIYAYPENGSAGQIAWRISDNKVYLSNSGSAGITVNLKIEMEDAT